MQLQLHFVGGVLHMLTQEGLVPVPQHAVEQLRPVYALERRFKLGTLSQQEEVK